jgi:WD40 repeat protein
MNPAEVPDFVPNAAVFSPDRRLLGLSDCSNNVELRDVDTGKPVVRLSKQHALYWIAVSPDGKVLATTASAKGIVRLWDIATGKELRELRSPGDWFASVQFSPAGETLVAASRTELWLWEVDTGKEVMHIKEAGGRVAFSPDGKKLAAAGDGPLRLWDMSTGREVGRFQGIRGWVHALAFSADGQRLCAVNGQDEAAIGIWDVATGKPLFNFDGHRGFVGCLAFAPDGKELASGGARGDTTLIVWNLATHKPRLRLADHHEGAVCCLAWSPDGKTLATGDGRFRYGTDNREAQIRFWDRSDGRLVRQFTGHLSSVFSLAFAPDSKALLSAGGDARAALWDVASVKRLHWLRGTEYPKFAAFSPDGKTVLVAGTWEGELSLWRTATGQKLRDIGPPAGGRQRLIPHTAWLPDGKTICTTEKLPRKEWDRARDPVPPPDLHRDRYEVRFWDAATGQMLRSFGLPHGPGIEALSPDGKTLAVSEGDYNQGGVIHLCDTATGERFLSLRGHAGAVESLAFSPDGKTLASGGSDTTVLLWAVARTRLNHLWSELTAGTDEEAQILKRLGEPAKAVPVLKARLLRLAELETQVGPLIAELDDDNFKVREKASAGLEELGEAAGPDLRLALDGRPSPEVRSRIQKILEKVEQPEAGAKNSPSQITLSLALIEEIGTVEARKALEELAGVRAESRVRREARAMLERVRHQEDNPGRKLP